MAAELELEEDVKAQFLAGVLERVPSRRRRRRRGGGRTAAAPPARRRCTRSPSSAARTRCPLRLYEGDAWSRRSRRSSRGTASARTPCAALMEGSSASMEKARAPERPRRAGAVGHHLARRLRRRRGGRRRGGRGGRRRRRAKTKKRLPHRAVRGPDPRGGGDGRCAANSLDAAWSARSSRRGAPGRREARSRDRGRCRGRRRLRTKKPPPKPRRKPLKPRRFRLRLNRPGAIARVVLSSVVLELPPPLSGGRDPQVGDVYDTFILSYVFTRASASIAACASLAFITRGSDAYSAALVVRPSVSETNRVARVRPPSPSPRLGALRLGRARDRRRGSFHRRSLLRVLRARLLLRLLRGFVGVLVHAHAHARVVSARVPAQRAATTAPPIFSTVNSRVAGSNTSALHADVPRGRRRDRRASRRRTCRGS